MPKPYILTGYCSDYSTAARQLPFLPCSSLTPLSAKAAMPFNLSTTFGLHRGNIQASNTLLEHASIGAGSYSDVWAAAGRPGWLWNACRLGARDVVLQVQVSLLSSLVGPMLRDTPVFLMARSSLHTLVLAKLPQAGWGRPPGLQGVPV